MAEVPDPSTPSAPRPPLSPALTSAIARGYFTVDEVAELLRVNAVTIYRTVRLGRFPALKLGARVIVPAQAIERMTRDAIESNTCIDVADYVVHRRGDTPPAQH